MLLGPLRRADPADENRAALTLASCSLPILDTKFPQGIGLLFQVSGDGAFPREWRMEWACSEGLGFGAQAVALQWVGSFLGVLPGYPLTPSPRSIANAWGKESQRQEVGGAGVARSPPAPGP